MELIDRRGFARVILVGTAVAAAGLAAGPGAAIAMPLDDRIPGALDDWIEKAQAVVVTSGPRRRPRAPRPTLLVAERPPRLRLALGLV